MSDLASRALALFDAYADLPAMEQSRRLGALAQEDPALHAALEAMLQADRRRGESLLDHAPQELIERAQSASDPVDSTDISGTRTGTRVGPWRIELLIASGGMGEVYEARRDDGQYQQRVALKFVRADLQLPQVVAAFRKERELLAQLDHPGIAGLLDGGIDANGQPWFAMRYVEGAPIDVWCDGRCLDVRRRIELLIQAGQALAYAHAQGVMHGDIKPANMLVDRDGRVQLVDFGISSLTDELGENVAITRDYAAPERLRLGTRAATTDIYAFGVLMYRLLSGQWPVPRSSLRGIVPMIDVEGRSLETLLATASPETARFRGARDVAALTRNVTGDLSAIARKAVAYRPEERYASMAAFVDDLQRWLDQRPVSARPLAWPERIVRTVKRNRMQTALAAILVAVILTAGSIAWQMHQRNAREAQASESVNQLFASNLGAATISGLGATPFSSDALLEKTERELRRLPLAGYPQLFARSLASLARSRAEIGDVSDANRLAEEAIRTLGNQKDASGFVAATQAAMLNIQGNHAQAAELTNASLPGLATCSASQRYCPRIALQAELARAQWSMGQPRSAMQTIDVALHEADRLDNSETTAELLAVRGSFAASLMQFKQAEDDDRRAIALVDKINPVLADDAREQLFGLLNQRVAPETLQFARQLLDSRIRTLGEHHPKTGWAWIHLGMVEHPKQAAQSMAKGLSIIEAVYGRAHPEYAEAIVDAKWHMSGTDREKLALSEQAVDVLTRTIGARAEPTLRAREGVGTLLLDMPDAARTPEDTERAFALLEGVIRDRDASGLPAPWVRLLLARGLIVYGAADRMADAGRLLDAAANDAKHYFNADDTYSVEAVTFRNKWLFRMGKLELADRAFSDWIERNRTFTAAVKADGGSVNDFIRAMTVYESLLYRGFYAYGNCDEGQAGAHWLQAQDLAVRAFGSDDFRVEIVKTMLAQLHGHAEVTMPLDAGFIPVPDLDAGNARAARCKNSGG